MKEKTIVVALACLVGTPIFGQQSKEMDWTQNFSLNGPIHIGDENIDSWAPLSGSCINIEFPAASHSSSYKLTYEPYGLEGAHIVLGDGRRMKLAAQTVISGVRPNYWGEQAELKFDGFANNENFSGQLCADFVEQGDLDDFMLQNVTIWVGSPKERSDEVSVVPKEPVKPVRPSVVTRAAPVAPTTPSAIAEQTSNEVPSIISDESMATITSENTSAANLVLKCNWSEREVLIVLAENGNSLSFPIHIVTDRANGKHEIEIFKSDAVMIMKADHISKYNTADALNMVVTETSYDLIKPTDLLNPPSSFDTFEGARIYRATGDFSVQFDTLRKVGKCDLVADSEQQNEIAEAVSWQFNLIRKRFVEKNTEFEKLRKNKKF